MTDKLIVFCNCGSADEAERIARTVVTKQLAACANILPSIRSIYRWQGAIEDATEHMLVMKTRAELYEALEREIHALHSYSVPEVIAMRIERGSQSYLNWIASETASN